VKLRVPSLRTLVQDAHRNGAVVNRFRVDASDVARIREAERKGRGLQVVLEILREKNQERRYSSPQSRIHKT